MMNGFGMGGGGWVVMILVWAVLLGVIVWAVMRIFSGHDGVATGGHIERPREILDRRLAHGEIDADTHERLRAKLVDHDQKR